MGPLRFHQSSVFVEEQFEDKLWSTEFESHVKKSYQQVFKLQNRLDNILKIAQELLKLKEKQKVI